MLAVTANPLQAHNLGERQFMLAIVAIPAIAVVGGCGSEWLQKAHTGSNQLQITCSKPAIEIHMNVKVTPSYRHRLNPLQAKPAVFL